MPAPAPGQDESRDGYIARRMTERTTPRTKAAAVPSVSLLGTRARTRKPKRCQPRELRQPPLASTRALSVPVFPPWRPVRVTMGFHVGQNRVEGRHA